MTTDDLSHIEPGLRHLAVPVSELKPYPNQTNTHDERNLAAIARSLRVHGQKKSLVANQQGEVIAGWGTVLAAAQRLGWTHLAVVFSDEDEQGLSEYHVEDNRTAELAKRDEQKLLAELSRLEELGTGPDELGWTQEEMAVLLRDNNQPGSNYNNTAAVHRGALVDRFGVPPFSVLDSRQGYWKERKRKWISLGIKSEVGRGDKHLGAIPPNQDALIGHDRHNKSSFMPKMAFNSPGGEYDYSTSSLEKSHGISVFDPVLCELVYRWFCPPEGMVLDPFAGGSVRGIVASMLGRRYIGVELRDEQVRANKEQMGTIGKFIIGCPHAQEDNTPNLTPVEEINGGYWAKRDDYYCIAGARGGKARACWQLAQGADGLVTAGSRSSPQVAIVASIAKRLGVPCRVHTPSGDAGDEVVAAIMAGAERVEHKPGYNTVITKRAHDDAVDRGWTEIPFGMECRGAVMLTAEQVRNIPRDAKRLVVPVGSGMSLSGILEGMKKFDIDIPVIGVVVGANPEDRLDRWAPSGWRSMVKLVRAAEDYHEFALCSEWNGIRLDPIYEAKTIRFLLPGDCLWIVGIRGSGVASEQSKDNFTPPIWIQGDSRNIVSLVPDGTSADLLFSCPPYGDLEVYSDDPDDISGMTYDRFLEAYGEIIIESCSLLRDDRFACFVVGDFRDKTGAYHGFPRHTEEAFDKAGLRLYNEAALVTPVGSLAIRVSNKFQQSRKLGKTHQNVLVFVKGDSRKAVAAIGQVDFGTIETDHD